MALTKAQPAEFNLWDGLVKPTEWYFGDAGKTAFEDAYANNGEMLGAIAGGNLIAITFNVCYQSSKKPVTEKKNWLIKYFYEYFLSRYSVKMACNEQTLVLAAVSATVTSCDGAPLLPYPDCLDGQRNPLLHYLSRVKDILPEGYSEIVYPVLKDVAHYVFNVLTLRNKDASREEFMYDRDFYLDSRGKPNRYGVLAERLYHLVEFPDCLNK